MKTAFIVNSIAVDRSAHRWKLIKSYLEEEPRFPYEIFFTSSGGQATEFARDAVKTGCDTVVAVGGDGTVNEVLNGILQSGKASENNIKLGIIPIGSGCDFARSLGISREPSDIVSIIKKGYIKRIDAGKTTFTNFEGKTETRYFINMADLGAGGVVVQKASNSPRIFGKRPNYLWGIISVAIGYKARNVRVSIDDGEKVTLKVRNLVVANGKYFGFGFMPAPKAELNDGFFDIVNMGDLGLFESLWNIPKLRKGTHLKLKKVSQFRGCRLAAESDELVLLEVDGELIGTLPATFEIMPRTINVIVPSTP